MYYSKKGKRVKILGLVGQIDDFISLFDLMKFAMEDELNFNQPIPLDFGPLSPVASVAGAFAQELKAEQDEILDEIVLKELEIAKQKGIEAVEQFVDNYGHNERYNYNLLAISNQTANKLMAGEFESFKKFEKEVLSIGDEYNEQVRVFYKEVYNENKEDYVHIIETIFINE